MDTISIGSKLTFQETNDFVNNVQTKLKSKPKGIRIDMKGCHYLNSIMLSGLIRVMKYCEKEQCPMVLVNINTSAKTLLETTNVDSLFTIDSEIAPEKTETLLDIDFEFTKDKYGLVTMKGSLNTPQECTKFRAFYEKHFASTKNGILNCHQLFHLSSSGVTEMFRLRGLLHEKKGKLILISNSDSVDSVWKMMHLESLIPRAEDLSHAEEILTQ